MSALAQQLGPGLLIATLAAPLIVLALFLAPASRDLARAITPLAPAPALAGGALAIGGAPFGAELPALRVSLWLDRPGGLLLLAAALVWLIVSVFALKEGQGRPNADRFAIAWLLTMAGSLGVFIAADLLTFYLVYALVSVPAYYLVAHDEDAASRRAGAVYLAFALLGEAVLLLAFVMLAAGEPSGSVHIRDVVAALPASPWRDGALALIIIGFGMKIALVPLHGWMPLTYRAAPIPAAAVLSGAGVKAGVIGLIRFLPLSAAFPGWGEALVWVGFISAFYGVAIGVTQRDPKTMLAYSSVSQMGVIAAALGIALAGADQGAATNVAFYAANHVLVKAALFLTLGVVADARRPRPNVGADRRGAARPQSRRTAADRGRAGQARAQGPVRRGGRGHRGSAVGGRHNGADAGVRHAARAFARSRAGRGIGRGRVVMGGAGRRRLAHPRAHVPRYRQRCRGARTREALGRNLADADRRRVAAGLWVVRDRLPRIPAGDIVVAEEAAFRASLSLGPMFERADRGLREWPAAGLALLMVALALVAAGYAEPVTDILPSVTPVAFPVLCVKASAACRPAAHQRRRGLRRKPWGETRRRTFAG